ncbi:hypothetical protein V2J09_000912 [Rumex salicifolius]
MHSVTSDSHTDLWIMDSDCSFHMNPTREWFKTYKVGNLGSVQLGDDKTCGIVGIGKIKVRMHDGIIRTLIEVHHIATLKISLVSLLCPIIHDVSKRINRSIAEKARCPRLNARLPKQFWSEAVSTAVYLINRSPRSSLERKVVEEVWNGKDIDLSNLRIFRCSAYVLIPNDY